MPYPLAAAHSRLYYPAGGSAPPPLPPFDNIAACWGLFNFNPDGYPAGDGSVGTSDWTWAFTEVAPFPTNWQDGIDNATPPYDIGVWSDQNAHGNDLTQADAAQPVLDATNHLISLDGVSQGLQGAASLYSGGTAKATIYIDFQPLNLSETGVILQTGLVNSKAQNILIEMVAGALTATVWDNTPVHPLANTKTKILAATDRIWVAVVIDVTLAPANQVQLYVNNSQAGVLAPISTDLSGLTIGNDVPSVGASNNAGLNFLTANMWEVRAQTNVDDAAAMLTQFLYWQYLVSLAP